MNGTAAKPRLIWLVAAVLFVFGCAALALVLGPTTIPARGTLIETVDRLTPLNPDSGLSPTQKSIVWNLRLPRVILGLLVGAGLATAGATYQGVFRNPLADPYLLGVAAGGGVGATIAFVRDLGRADRCLHRRARRSGTHLASRRCWRSRPGHDLAHPRRYRRGKFLHRHSDVPPTAQHRGHPPGLHLVPRRTNYLGLVRSPAAAAGCRRFVDRSCVPEVRIGLLVVASLLTAAVVAVSGLIGFVGLVVPHAVRLLFGSSFRIIVPLSVFVGAGFLVLCDLAARSLLVPAEIPIGVITAFFGAPFFIFILRTSGRS